MLKFTCGNFLSFGKKFGLDNIVVNNKSNNFKKSFFKRNLEKNGTLKGATIYGLNALEKSNFLESIKYQALDVYQNKILRKTYNNTKFEYRKRMIYQEKY